VDHRGLLRVYARDLKTVELYSGASYHESKTFPLFTPVPLDLAPVKQIQSRILDGPKFLTSSLDGLGKYVTLTDDAWSSESYSRYSNTYKILQKVNHVNVSNYVASQTSSFLKFPVPKLSDIQRDSDYIKYSKMYSRVFNLVIHTRHGVHFPSGLSLKASHPFYKEFMSTPLPKGFLEDTYLRISIKEPTPADILRRAQNSQGVLRAQNKIYEYLYQEFLKEVKDSHRYQKPFSYYPFQLSGYLLLFYSRINKPVFDVYKKQNKLYLHESYHEYLKQLKLIVTQVLRFYMLYRKDSKQLSEKIRQYIIKDPQIDILQNAYTLPPIHTTVPNRIFGIQISTDRLISSLRYSFSEEPL
jgi:hypothetical protein